jgi:2-methylcitrate dehydratase PrpD
MTAALGQTWEILDVTFKLYPVCAFNQVPVAAAVGAIEEAGWRAADIDRVEVEMNEYEFGYPGMSRATGFETVAQTLMSTRFTVAAGLVEGGLAYGDLLRFDDPQILSLVERIDVVSSEGRPPMTAAVTLTSTSGQTVEKAVNAPEELLTWGFDDAPRMAAGLIAESPLSQADADRLLDLIGRVGDLDRAGALLDPLVES